MQRPASHRYPRTPIPRRRRGPAANAAALTRILTLLLLGLALGTPQVTTSPSARVPAFDAGAAKGLYAVERQQPSDRGQQELEDPALPARHTTLSITGAAAGAQPFVQQLQGHTPRTANAIRAPPSLVS